MREEISLVDDDGDLIETIRIVLESNRCRVSAPNEPQTGLSKAPTDRADLTQVDVRCPLELKASILSGRSEIFPRNNSATYRSPSRPPLKDVAVQKPRRSGQPQPVVWGNGEPGEI
jgi:hypothetical protein